MTQTKEMLVPPVRTVAVIDDDRRVLTSLANLLASGGYGTRVYESPVDFFADGYSGLLCVITDQTRNLAATVRSDVGGPQL
jgi:FixJ family two-component response regulator